MISFHLPLLLGLVLTVISYFLAPKPKASKPEAATEMENPTAESGKTMPVVFGSMTIKSSNILWYGDKSMKEYKVK